MGPPPASRVWGMSIHAKKVFAEKPYKTKVKICGLTNLQDARFASGALVQYLGFIFYDKSPRYIEPAQAGAMINWIEGPQCVGIFVNQSMDDVNIIARQTGIDLVQLHGNESPEYCALMERPVIKAIHVSEEDTEQDIEEKSEPYLGTVDYLLFDTKVKGFWGGTGKSFDWNLIKKAARGIPFFLSGGIGSENVGKACQTVQPFAVDLSSSLESEPGRKDYDKIEDFMDQMREIWEEQEK